MNPLTVTTFSEELLRVLLPYGTLALIAVIASFMLLIKRISNDDRSRRSAAIKLFVLALLVTIGATAALANARVQIEKHDMQDEHATAVLVFNVERACGSSVSGTFASSAADSVRGSAEEIARKLCPDVASD